jgi:hypothetical protein
MEHRSRGAALILILVLPLAGCVTYHADYKPAYVPRQGGGMRIEGKAALYTDPSDENYVFSGKPGSFTGGGSTLVMPLGRINKEVARMVFGRLFRGGCAEVPTREGAAGYAAVIQPRVVSFDYRYNRMRNLDFATTPQVNLNIQVTLYDAQGTLFFTKTYGTGTYNGESVLDTLKPAELINRTTHEAAAHLYAQAAADIEAQLRSRPAAPSPAPPQAVAPAAGSAADRLQDLKRLFDDGLITKEAYEKKQQEILNAL